MSEQDESNHSDFDVEPPNHYTYGEIEPADVFIDIVHIEKLLIEDALVAENELKILNCGNEM